MGRKKIYVSSVIYNLAGNYDERTDYIKHLVLQGVITDSSIGSTLINGTIQGPRSEAQNYFRWAKRNYDMGMPEGGIFKTDSLDVSLLAPHIIPEGEWLGWDVEINRAGLDLGSSHGVWRDRAVGDAVVFERTI